MNNLTRITSSPELRIKLSELLSEKLGIVNCWHEWNGALIDSEPFHKCIRCGYTISIHNIAPDNPDLFTRSAFLDVFDAVKDREGFQVTWGHWHNLDAVNEEVIYVSISMNDIASPFFQYEVLKMLLEQDSEGGRLEEIMNKEVDKS